MMEVKQSIPNIGLPKKQGLYDPKFEKDNCGIGFIANIKGEKSHEIVEKGLLIYLIEGQQDVMKQLEMEPV